jgi:hypothetical protein
MIAIGISIIPSILIFILYFAGLPLIISLVCLIFTLLTYVLALQVIDIMSKI